MVVTIMVRSDFKVTLTLAAELVDLSVAEAPEQTVVTAVLDV
jgi:hypothetical protein